MHTLIEHALRADVSAAVRAVAGAASSEAGRQAMALIGTGPTPGTDAWRAEEGTDTPAQRQLAWQIAALRIELGAGADPLPTVINLRRFGATWATIGEAAGMTRQSAHEKWGAGVRAVLDRYGTGELGGPVADDDPA